MLFFFYILGKNVYNKKAKINHEDNLMTKSGNC